jgi:hypothetical protein
VRRLLAALAILAIAGAASMCRMRGLPCLVIEPWKRR